MNAAPSSTTTAPVRSGAPLIDPDEGRAVLSTLNDDGTRRWIHPRVSRGRFLIARRSVAYILIAIFALLPFIHVHGRPLILLDVVARRFHLFGATFYPTDTLLLALLLVTIFLSIFWITALFGRIWCGWACPQTVYMEFLFRPLERLFDGAPGRARKGIQGTPFGKVLKFAAYFAASFFLAHTFLAYFVSWNNLHSWIFGSPGEHIIGFGVVAFITGAMLFNFGYFREQVCLVACPYGRFQSVLLDRHSMIIRYDTVRGEPRGKDKKASIALPVLAPPAKTGDCIDCRMCVTTCPTGIDIRNGLQLECVGCAQCIDACDAVMDKIGRARGLIRYSSQAAMEGRKFQVLRPRVVLYPLVIIGIAALFTIVLLNTGIADVTVLRGVGLPFTTTPAGEVSNIVRIKISNRLETSTRFAVALDGVEGARLSPEAASIEVGPGQMLTTPAQILASKSAFRAGRAQAFITISGPNGFVSKLPFTLLGPGDGAPLPAGDSSRPAKEESHP